MRTAISVIAICAVFLVGNEAIRLAYYKALSKSHPEFYATKSQTNYQDAHQIVFLGDSVIATGLYPSLIPDSYNHAWLGASYIANYFTLEWMLRSNPTKLEVILLPFDRHSFTGKRFDIPITLEKVTLLEVVRADIRNRKPGQYVRGWVHDRLFPYADAPRLITKQFIRDLPIRQDGFLPLLDHMLQTPAEMENSAKKVARSLFQEEPWYDERMAWYLDAMLQRARDNGLKVVLVQCPIMRALDAEMRNYVPNDAFESHKASVLAKFPEVALLNYQERFFDQPELFYDANHLHVSGARIFSKMVRDDLERLGYLARHD